MHDRRLIEDYLPIQAISAEASREKSVRKGHISTLHLWWARRPLVACRAAVYGALVPAERFRPKNGPEEKRDSLMRANAAKFVERLCKYPGNPSVIKEAQRHILEAHAERLSRETGKKVTVEDIVEGRAPRPKVLDMFAGGGAIPLEALRLGCEAYALDLNPVAHIIELCTLVYPQKYGKPDPNARGMTGPPGPDGKPTWGGLAEEVRYWGNWVLKKVKAEIGDLYPLIPDPEAKKNGGTGFQPVEQKLFKTRRNLPHWQLGGSTYFVTFRTKGVELTPPARQLVLNSCLHFDGNRYNLWTAVVMPDHVHLLLQPIEAEKGQWHSLSSILHSIKSFTANKVNNLLCRKGTLWQDESFDRIVRDEGEFYEKWNYIRNNPVKNGLVDSPENWTGFYECTGKMPVPPDSSLDEIPPGYLVPVAYLWTRTVRCKNPSCGATVPLVKQTWLCKKKGGKKSPGRYVALKMVAQAASLREMGMTGQRPVPQEKKVRFEVVEATTQEGLGFDPSIGSKGGNATCPFCGTVADIAYVKEQGRAGRMSERMMAVVCIRPGQKGKVYVAADVLPDHHLPHDQMIARRIAELCKKSGLTVPDEPIANLPDDCYENTLGITVRPYGIRRFRDLFTPRQMLCLLTFAAAVRELQHVAARLSLDEERAKAVGTYLAVLADRIASAGSTLSRWNNVGEKIESVFSRQALPMVWDFAESSPFGRASGGADNALAWVVGVAEAQSGTGTPATVTRGSATSLPWQGGTGGSPVLFDAVITDPPYYDNVPYADISDFFYVWLKRTIGHLYPEHFATEGTPKKKEAVADALRYGGSKVKARQAYEQMMAQSFAEANRVLKPGGQMVVVYAHKTTLGWSTLVDALREAGFTVTEAWPLDTEMGARLRAMDSAALASSIFLVARKRGSGSLPDSHDRLAAGPTGSYEEEVRPELEQIVRERVDTLWKMGITGADLKIAAVGAGMRAFTRFARVEYANGEEVPAEKFLAEVEGIVQEFMLERIFGVARSGVAAVDGPSRFYVLWRYTYKAAVMDAGEAIVFTYGQNVELDGPNGLSTGNRALVEKKKGKYRLRDFTERGDNEKLGLPADDGTPPPLIDALHRILWLIENEPRSLNRFLDEARPDRERLRLVAQALAGTALEGTVGQAASLSGMSTTSAEQTALRKLVANWRALIDQRLAMDEGTLFDLGRK